MVFHCMNISPSTYIFYCCRHLSCSHLWAIIDNAAMNVLVHVFQYRIPVGYISRGGIAEAQAVLIVKFIHIVN